MIKFFLTVLLFLNCTSLIAETRFDRVTKVNIEWEAVSGSLFLPILEVKGLVDGDAVEKKIFFRGWKQAENASNMLGQFVYECNRMAMLAMAGPKKFRLVINPKGKRNCSLEAITSE